MKKTVNLLALGILLGVEVLTPITYAQQANDSNLKSELIFTEQVEDEKTMVEKEGTDAKEDVNDKIDGETIQNTAEIKELEEESKILNNGLSDGSNKVEEIVQDGESNNSDKGKDNKIDNGENYIEKFETQAQEDDNIENLGQRNASQKGGQLRGVYNLLSKSIKDGEINENKATELLKIIGWLDDFGAIEKQGPDDGVIKVLSGKLLFEIRELDNSRYFIRLGDDVTSEDSIRYRMTSEQRQHMTGYSDYTDIELKFIESSYITFDMNGHGDQQDQIIVLTGQLPKKPKNPSAEGYAFKGWYTTPGCEEGTEYNFNTKLTGDVTLYAKRRDGSEGYKITFDMNGHGEQTSPVYGFPGEFPDQPDIPSTQGYVFRGWYRTPGCDVGTKYNFDTELTGDITLYAKWSECGDGFRIEDNKCVQNSIEGVIKVTNGIDTIYIKDRNQGAEISYGLMPTLYMQYLSNLVIDGVITQEEAGEEIITYTNNMMGTSFTGVEEIGDYFYYSGGLKDLFSTGSKYSKSFGTYYYRGNNSGAEYDELNINFDNSTVDISNELKERGFNGGKLGEGGEGWIEGNINPCDASKGEYLPTREDWENLMEIWADDKGYDVVTENQYGDNYFYIGDDLGSDMQGMFGFMQDMLIPLSFPLLPGNQLGELGLWASQNENGEIGVYQGLLVYSDVNTFISQSGNFFAMPVRCFVNPLDSYLVTYDSNNGSEVGKQTVVSGGKIVQPESPTRAGYTFEGWYKDTGLTEKWDFGNDVVMDDTTLYAKWIENKPSGGSSGGGGGGGGSSSSQSSTGSAEGQTGSQINSNTGDTVSSGTNKQEPESQTGSQVDPLVEPQNDDNAKNVISSDNEKSTNGGVEYSEEFQQAYEFAKKNGITTMSTIQKAKMNSPLTRIAMAKMLSQYAINILGQTPDETRINKFNDVTEKMDKDYDNGVTLAYQLGIMGQNMPNNKFRPNDEVTRAEFVTAFSRMLYNTIDGEFESTSKYYTHHMEKLEKEGIVTNTNPSMKERRGYVMIMLMRSAE